MSSGDWAAWTAAGISALFGVQSWWSARKAGKAEEASAELAGRWTRAQERIADAIEARNAAPAETPPAASEVPPEEMAPWRIERTGGMAWDLVNTTPRPKYHIEIGGPAIIPGDQAVIPMMSGNSSVDIEGAFIAMQSTNRITIMWHLREDRTDEQLQWVGKLPTS